MAASSTEGSDDDKGKDRVGDGLKPARLKRNWSGTTLLVVYVVLSSFLFTTLLKKLAYEECSFYRVMVLLSLTVMHIVSACIAILILLGIKAVPQLSTRLPAMLTLSPIPLAALLDSIVADELVPVRSIGGVIALVVVVLFQLLTFTALASQANDQLTQLFRPFNRTYKRHGLLIKLKDFV